MPLETVRAFQDHGKVARTLDEGLREARRVFAELARLGVDYGDLTDTLEREGVEKFAQSFDELLDGVRAKRGELAAA
jgi:transaldolase